MTTFHRTTHAVTLVQDYGILASDPMIFCGGDFRQHINRSQPNEWLHPIATTTLPMIGFRVACDLTAASIVSLPKHWPINQLFLSQEFVRVRTLADSVVKSSEDNPNEAKPDASATQLAGKLINSVWLEMLVRAEQMPYAVEWLDFEIERRLASDGENPDPFVQAQIADSGAETGWKPIDLAPALRLLEQTEFAPDPIATPLLNPVLTMPIPKAVSGQWRSPGNRRGLPPESDVRLEPAIQKPQLFRFIDFHTPHGSHRYRVRLKYRVLGIIPDSIHTTSWFLSAREAQINLDFDPGNLPENIPVIELKPQPPVDPLVVPTDHQGFRNRRRPVTSSPSN